MAPDTLIKFLFYSILFYMKEKFPPVSQLTIRPTLNFIGNHCSVFFKKNFKKIGRFVFVACCWCWILSTLHTIGLRKKDVSYRKEMALPKTWSRIFKTTKFNATQSRLLQDLQTWWALWKETKSNHASLLYIKHKKQFSPHFQTPN